MITIAIIDDSMEYADVLQKKLQKTDFQDELSVNLYINPKSFLIDLERGKRYQLCFLDVKMPEMDGVKLAEEIRKKNGRMLLIFLSSYSEYAIEGYRVNAFDYLLKGRLDDKWDMLICRILKRLEDDRKKVYRVITQNKIQTIPIDSIIYIYKEGKYCIFVLENEREKIAYRKTIKEMKKDFQGYKNFIQIERGYIVNIEKIQKYTAIEVVMENGDKLVIGRAHIASVKELVMRYLEEL